MEKICFGHGSNLRPMVLHLIYSDHPYIVLKVFNDQQWMAEGTFSNRRSLQINRRVV